MAEDSIPTHRVRGDGADLSVTVRGEGPPVVFLHGFPENARSWRHQIDAVAGAGLSAWAPDLRGYGRSSRPLSREAYRLQHLVADVAAIVGATRSARAHLVGHDWGGVIAWSVAAQHPELVDKLVIINAPHPAIYAREVWRSSQLFRSWYVGLFLLPHVAEWLLSADDFAALRRLFRLAAGSSPPFTAGDVEAYITQFREPGALTAALNYYRANASLGAPHVADTTRIAAETLVLWGEKDSALGAHLLDGLDALVRQLQVRRFADLGHWVHNEAPTRVNRLLLEFLTSRDRAES